MSLPLSVLFAVGFVVLVTRLPASSLATEGVAQGPVQNDAGAALEKAFPTNALGVLSSCQSMELYSLDPSKVLPFGQGFHQWRIVNTASVDQVEAQKEIVQSVLAGVRKGAGGVPPTCFRPRHGIRASQGRQTVDLLVCFDCGHLYTYAGSTNGYAVFHGDKKTRDLLDSILRRSANGSPHGP